MNVSLGKPWIFAIIYPEQTEDLEIGPSCELFLLQSMFEQKYEKSQIFFYMKLFSLWRWNFLYIWMGVFS